MLRMGHASGNAMKPLRHKSAALLLQLIEVVMALQISYEDDQGTTHSTAYGRVTSVELDQEQSDNGQWEFPDQLCSQKNQGVC